MAKNKEVTFHLTEDQYQMIEALAKSQKITTEVALENAIKNELYIQQKRVEGNKILLQDKNNRLFVVG